MTEPVLTYKKGEGWIYGEEHETITEIINGYRVTLIKRQPEIGEFYFSDQGELKQTMEALKAPYWSDHFSHSSRFVKWDGTPRYGRPTRTLILEPV